MNKKIYFNDKFIELSEDNSQSSNNQSINFLGTEKANKKELKKITDNFLNDNNNRPVMWKINDFESFFNSFKSLFYYIEAAGGFIEKEKQFLFIHRHGRWDLPKGKLEKNESIEAGAIRECEEECGIKELKIVKQLSSTFHIYAYKDGFALKQSYWFYMQTNFSGKLIPQLEENIDEVRFFSEKEIREKILNDTYYTIADITKEALKLKSHS